LDQVSTVDTHQSKGCPASQVTEYHYGISRIFYDFGRNLLVRNIKIHHPVDKFTKIIENSLTENYTLLEANKIILTKKSSSNENVIVQLHDLSLRSPIMSAQGVLFLLTQSV